jgi:hypothetical protein
MKSISILFFLCLIVCHSISQLTKKQSQDTLIWNKSFPLVKENFSGKRNGKAPAFTACGMFFYSKEKNGNMLFYVEAIFLKSKSYMRDSSAYILKHEQLHFDICELYSRKMRQQISEKDFKKVKNVRQEIQRTYDKFSREMEKEEIKYDNDCEHGMNAAKQKVWMENISQELSSLNKYEATEIDITQ